MGGANWGNLAGRLFCGSIRNLGVTALLIPACIFHGRSAAGSRSELRTSFGSFASLSFQPNTYDNNVAAPRISPRRSRLYGRDLPLPGTLPGRRYWLSAHSGVRHVRFLRC